jgi:methyl-accepting chemotaxis protein
MLVIQQGCASELLSNKLTSAEKKLSHGRPAVEDLKKEPAPVLPSSAAARYKLALIMDSFIKGESSLATTQEELKKMRDDTFTPYNQMIEAGYLSVMVEKMESLQKSINALSAKSKECAKESEELRKTADQMKKENDDMKKEIELLSYKLKKLEEIHIETEKRRGKQ